MNNDSVPDGYDQMIKEHCDEVNYLVGHAIPLLKIIKTELKEAGFNDREVEGLTPVVASKTLTDRYYWKRNKKYPPRFQRGDEYE